jgi:hypothetical protein
MRPLDLFTAEVPSLWLQDMGGGGVRLGVVNWTDETAIRGVDLRELTGRGWPQVTDFWSGDELLQTAGGLQLELAPHETKLLVLVDG